MGLRTLILAAALVATCLASLGAPIWGVLGYVCDYSVGTTRHWWGQQLAGMGVRLSLTLAAATALGIALQWRRLRFGGPLLSAPEKIMLVFVAATFLPTLYAPEPDAPMFDPANLDAARSRSDPRTWSWDQNARGLLGREQAKGQEERFWRERERDIALAYAGLWGQQRYSVTDHPTIKMAKVLIFILMLTHVVTDLKGLNRLMWMLILGALFLGVQAWQKPPGGRLNTVGGSDFAESNFFAAYMASMLWLIGVQFLRSGWKGKIVCSLAGGFTANAIVLARSRGAVVGLAAGGLVAVCLAPRRYRPLIVVGLIVAAVGFFSLTDQQFVSRIGTLTRSAEERDSSAQSRLVLAEIAVKMWSDYPLGVGVGNFRRHIGNYNIHLAGKDNHNTYLRCLTEMGIQGFVVFLLLIGSVLLTLRRSTNRAAQLPAPGGEDLALIGFGMTCALATLLTCCLVISLTYTEFFWWFLALPICFQRAVYNYQEDLATAPALERERQFSVSTHLSGRPPGMAQPAVG